MFGEVVNDPQQVDRATKALQRAIAPGPDDFAHPDHQDLVAFADGTLDAVDRELVQSHIALCRACAEDVKDVVELREQLAGNARPTNSWKYMTAAAVAIAAVLVVAVMLRKPAQEPVAETTKASAPSASPRETGLTSEEKVAVDAATSSGHVDVPATVRELAGSMGQLLGSESATSSLLPMSPSGTLVVNVAPQFTWRALSGARSYRVAIFDASFREVAASPALKDVTWTPSVALPRNVPLAWQVTALMADGSSVLAPAPPRPEARFSVVDEAEAARIAELKSRFAAEPIRLGILLAKAGLVDDAAREFARAAEQPASADLAKKLQASLSRK